MYGLQLWSILVLKSNDIRSPSPGPALDGPDRILQSVVNEYIPSHRSRNRGSIQNGGIGGMATACLSWMTHACGRSLTGRLLRHGSIDQGPNAKVSMLLLPLVERACASESDDYTVFIQSQTRVALKSTTVARPPCEGYAQIDGSTAAMRRYKSAMEIPIDALNDWIGASGPNYGRFSGVDNSQLIRCHINDEPLK